MDANDLLSLHASDEIELRILSENDADFVFSVIDKNRTRLKEWLGWLDKINSVEDSKTIILEKIKAYYDKKNYRFGIFYCGDFSGIIELKSIDYGNKKSSIGYWLAEGFEGKGIMTQSVTSLLNFAFIALNLNKVELYSATGNLSSNKLAERIGFIKDGILRQNEWLYDHFVDHNAYSMLKDEWKSKAK